MDISPLDDDHFMRQALIEAQKAFEMDEVPVGAVIVCNQKIIARAHNFTERLHDFTAHAEMQAFTSASEYLGSKYLNNCIMYVTLEPCIMCAGASFWTRVGKIVFGAPDEKRGYQRLKENILHPSTEIKGGVLKDDCAELLKAFFASKR
ncbi:MAG: nucleoside deaminase [Flavobacteriales bacterium]|nr:nucleoside deaminase [Flavobacteriales bacterium]